MDMSEVNEFKIEKIERQSRNLGAEETLVLLQSITAGFGLGISLIMLNPIGLLGALALFLMTQMDKEIVKDIKKDIEKVKSIEDEEDLKEYKIERIETCEKEITTQKQVQLVYGIATAVAVSGLLLAPAAWLTPLYVFTYGFTHSLEREELANHDLEMLSNKAQEENMDSREKPKVKCKTSTNIGNAAYAH